MYWIEINIGQLNMLTNQNFSYLNKIVSMNPVMILKCKSVKLCKFYALTLIVQIHLKPTRKQSPRNTFAIHNFLNLKENPWFPKDYLI